MHGKPQKSEYRNLALEHPRFIKYHKNHISLEEREVNAQEGARNTQRNECEEAELGAQEERAAFAGKQESSQVFLSVVSLKSIDISPRHLLQLTKDSPYESAILAERGQKEICNYP